MADQEHVRRCMEQVEAYRASGQKAKVWAAAHGVPLGTLGSWCAHYERWRALRDGGPDGAGAGQPAPRPSGFVAARLAAPAAASSVRIDVTAGAARLELHWPPAHARELAVLLRELSR